MLRVVARLSARYRIIVIAAWLGVLVCGAVSGPHAFARLSGDSTETSMESIIGKHLVEAATPTGRRLAKERLVQIRRS